MRLLSLGDKQLSAFDISLRFTHLFWCGDLNYRLDLDVEVHPCLSVCLDPAPHSSNSETLCCPLQEILRHVTKREFEELMCADQLTRERDKRKAFLHFSEWSALFLFLSHCDSPSPSLSGFVKTLVNSGSLCSVDKSLVNSRVNQGKVLQVYIKKSNQMS